MPSDVSCHDWVTVVSTNINQMLPPPLPGGVWAYVPALHRLCPQLEEVRLDGTPSRLWARKCSFVSTGFSNQEAHLNLGTSCLVWKIRICQKEHGRKEPRLLTTQTCRLKARAVITDYYCTAKKDTISKLGVVIHTWNPSTQKFRLKDLEFQAKNKGLHSENGRKEVGDKGGEREIWDYKAIMTAKFQGRYVSFLFLCLTWDCWMIYKHYINSHAKLQDHICLIPIPTYESGHSRPKTTMLLDFSVSRHHGSSSSAGPSMTQAPPSAVGSHQNRGQCPTAPKSGKSLQSEDRIPLFQHNHLGISWFLLSSESCLEQAGYLQLGDNSACHFPSRSQEK